MSLDTAEDGRSVHFPANPEKFEFDAEVSAIFDGMAERSIPNFRAAHLAHARMLSTWVASNPHLRVLDVGASRGAFFRALFQCYPALSKNCFDLTAVDSSPQMCEHLNEDFPFATIQCLDITTPEFLGVTHKPYDVVCAHYVLQFLPPEMQVQVLLKLTGMVKPGGVFILGHKHQHFGVSGDAAHEEYIRFRMDRGYTREEIEAKTKALRNSMWPMSHRALMKFLDVDFYEVTETFRFMMFSTLFCVK